MEHVNRITSVEAETTFSERTQQAYKMAHCIGGESLRLIQSGRVTDEDLRNLKLMRETLQVLTANPMVGNVGVIEAYEVAMERYKQHILPHRPDGKLTREVLEDLRKRLDGQLMLKISNETNYDSLFNQTDDDSHLLMVYIIMQMASFLLMENGYF